MARYTPPKRPGGDFGSDPLADLVAQFGDSEIPGGCEHCDAYQTMKAVVPHVYRLTVHHDDDCPTWRAVNAGAN